MLKRMKLGYTIFLSVSAAIFFLFLLGSWVAYVLIEGNIAAHIDEDLTKTVKGIRRTVETSATLSARSYLRAVAEQHLATVNGQYRRSVSGEINEEEARRKSQARIVVDGIGKSGYTYIIDSQGVLQAHPVTLLAGRDISEWQFVQQQISRKKGFIEYEWQNPGEPAPRKKVLYMDYFAPWDWIISVTAYRDELAQLIDPGDFRDKILSIRIAEHGYPFVIDTNGRVLAHPTLSGNVLDSNEYRGLFRDMIKSGAGRVSYDWTDPRTGESKTKIAVFETVDEFPWIVAATGYVEDFYKPLRTLKHVLLGLLVCGLVLALVISSYLSSSITAPLRSLLKQISAEKDPSGAVQPDGPGGNEIEELSRHFSEYVRELNERNQTLRQTSLDLNIYKEIFENIVEGITITDGEGTIVRANPAFERITGYSAEEAVGNNPRILKSDRHPPAFYDEMWAMLVNNGFWSGEIWNRRKNGEVYPEWLTISAVCDKSGRVTHYAAVFNDITKLIKQQERIQFLAFHDYLTRLPNRLLVQERLGQMIAECRHRGEKLICLICDLDNFKNFNESLGHEGGDRLLNMFVELLRPALRSEDTLGRIGGDEFVVLAQTKDCPERFALAMAERIISASVDPVHLGEQLVYLTISIGIALYPEDAEEGEELLKRAMLALNSAGKARGNSISFFKPPMEHELLHRMMSLAKIREGLANNEFIPYYQPKVDLASGRITGMEALARWMSGGQLVPPGQFIPIAEDSGLIMQMARQIYQKAFRDTAGLLAQGYRLKLSVNVSPMQLQAPSFLEELLALQRESGLAAEHIELEITESTLFENTDQVLLQLDAIVTAGFTISIDDFGTGYSSLQYLKQLPLTTLKMDMSFVSGIGKNKDDEQLVRTIALLAKQFGLQVVAEGVEEEAQVAFLRLLGCNDGQGYYFAKPMSLDDFLAWLSLSGAAKVSSYPLSAIPGVN